MASVSYPTRRPLQHTAPHSVDASGSFYFVTICAAERDQQPLPAISDAIFSAARFYHSKRKWFLSLLLVMPDHMHLVVHGNTTEGSRTLASLIGDFKRFITTQTHVEFQKDFFETRLRDEAHYEEKWRYILYNPVRKGLVKTPREWPHVIAFNRETGAELPHR